MSDDLFDQDLELVSELTKSRHRCDIEGGRASTEIVLRLLLGCEEKVAVGPLFEFHGCPQRKARCNLLVLQVVVAQRVADCVVCVCVCVYNLHVFPTQEKVTCE